MRRRNHLRPDTFPFLAVLLCAMGSLILVLLELDRRARSAAHSRAEQVWKDTQKEKVELLARLRAERLAEQQAHLDRHRTEQTGLKAQEQGVLAKRAQVQGQLDELLQSLRTERDRQTDAQKRIAAEAARVQQARRDLAAREKQLGQAAGRVAGVRSDRERLTRDLLLMEEALARLKEQRARDSKKWSLVPYVGRRGLSRKPLYVECAADRLVFYPDRRAQSGFSLSDDTIRDEVTRRMKGQAEPYWMLLVRPDGILSYYQFLQATRGLDITYGYEFVDATWDFDFPAPLDAPPAIEVTTPLPTPTHRTDAPRVLIGQPTPPRGSPAAARLGHPGVSAPGGTPGGGPPRPAGGGEPGLEPLFPSGGGPGHGSGEPGQGAPGAPPGQAGGGPSQPDRQANEGERGPPGGSPPRPPGGDRPGLEPLFPSGGGPARGTGEPIPGGPAKPPEEAGGDALPGPSGGGPSQPARPAGEGGGGKPQPGLPGEDPRGPAQPVRPALREGNRDWLVIVECRPDEVRVSPSRAVLSLSELSAEQGKAALVRTVQDLVARRRAAQLPDEPEVRIIIRFQVQKEGTRVFHLVYPLLDRIDAEKRTVMSAD